MRRNRQVVIPDHCALRFQICANRSVGLCRRFRQRERRKHVDEFSEALQSRSALRTFICPVEQLSKSNYRKRRLSRTQLSESAQDFLWPFLADVNANLRIQQEARLPQSPLRFCGLPSGVHAV